MGRVGMSLCVLMIGLTGLADDVLPVPVTEESFSALKESSPFRRSIDFSDSLVLTGMARIEGNVFATLFDTASTQSLVVSESANAEGWHLVGVRGDEADLETLTAKVQVAAGEVVSIRYEKLDLKSSQSRPGGGSGAGGNSGKGQLSQEQIAAAKKAGADPGAGFRGDGYRDAPPPEILEKLNRISPQQREALARQTMEMRNRGVGSEERQKFYREAVDRAAQGRR